MSKNVKLLGKVGNKTNEFFLKEGVYFSKIELLGGHRLCGKIFY